MFKHLLVPTDGSDLSESTVRRAVTFAKECGARITFFHVGAIYPDARLSFAGGMLAMTPEKFEQANQTETARILDFATRLGRDAGVECDAFSVPSDDPAEAIIAAAKECNADLIFMASHGRRGIKSLLLGSETNKVLTHSKIPVLVYR